MNSGVRSTCCFSKTGRPKLNKPAAAAGAVDSTPAHVARLVGMFTDTATDTLIRNLRAEVTAFQRDEICLPVSFSNGDDDGNCYICNPTSAYVDYAIEETRNFAFHSGLKRALTGLTRGCSPLIRATGLDHQVQLNNWLFSTNPVPTLSGRDMAAIRDEMMARHPDRAIVLRSLNTMADTKTIASAKSAGFVLLASRQIYIFDAQSSVPPSGHVKRDRKLVRKSEYRIIPADVFSTSDFARAEDLYNMLYLQKYTPLNPQYTALFLQRAHEHGLLRLIGLRGPRGRLDGVLGLFENGKTLTHPIIGYDTSLPQKLGLYRMLSSIAQDHAVAHGTFFNMSAGAATFKRNRNAVAAIEYTAVYVAHLGWKNRFATRVAKIVLDRIGIPLLKRFEL